MKINLSELGSEYWLDENISIRLSDDIITPNWLQCSSMSSLLLFSGRTAIDFILSDIEKERVIQNAYMPSYCCGSMLAPFLKRGIGIQYYDVVYDSQFGIKPRIDENVDCDILFILDYFGFIISDSNLLKYFKNKGSIVVEDRTHSIFSKSSISEFVHYSFASLRKWFGVLSGAIIYKQGDLGDKEVLCAPSYVSLKYDAMKLKCNYLKNIGCVDKSRYLSLFSQFNQNLYSDYCNYSIDILSSHILNAIDINHLKERRRENAFFLYEGLSEIRCIKPIFKNVKEDVCPLFLPVLVENGLRDNLVSFLKLYQIYCPIHWQISDVVKLNDNTRYLYENELSLLCDQRYGIEQMRTILSALKKFDSKIY